VKDAARRARQSLPEGGVNRSQAGPAGSNLVEELNLMVTMYVGKTRTRSRFRQMSEPGPPVEFP